MPFRRRRSTGTALFTDRVAAGRLLATELNHVSGDALIVGLARGGAVLAAEVARELSYPLDVLAVRKIRHPWQPEYAIGAVAPRSRPYIRGGDSLSADQVARAVATARNQAESLDAIIHASEPQLPVKNTTCVLVDDGLATGATMYAAVDWARESEARTVIAAVPVGASPTVESLAAYADGLVCLNVPVSFIAVGLHYEDFGEVSDEEVVTLLKQARRSPSSPPLPRQQFFRNEDPGSP